MPNHQVNRKLRAAAGRPAAEERELPTTPGDLPDEVAAVTRRGATNPRPATPEPEAPVAPPAAGGLPSWVNEPPPDMAPEPAPPELRPTPREASTVVVREAPGIPTEDVARIIPDKALPEKKPARPVLSRAEQARRDRLAESGFIVVDEGQEEAVLAANSAHTRRRISTLPGGTIRGGRVVGSWDGAWSG